MTRSPSRKLVMNTSLPSGVNLRRLEAKIFASNVAVTFLLARSIMDSEPSCEFAVYNSRPSGETSKPSSPLPTPITVSFQFIQDRHADAEAHCGAPLGV